ncbi:MAG: peptidyl-prolyl cis-trans isomerase, partial [Alphaproteobacteria bacterium]|nr:peptidyl-prolyl cis-trans isomerase [Alphaproteobacteria bacterium]
ARKAIDLFKAGKPLKTIARELNITVKDLGTLKKADVNPAHAEDIFALDVGSMSKPFDSDKGWVLFSVNKIIPGSQKSYAEAKAAIEVALKDERFNEHFEALQNKVEDALAGGTKIQEVAHTHNLIIETFKAVDKFGQDEEGNKTLDETIQKDVLDYAFANSQGAESNMILAKESADAQGNSKLVGFIVRVDAIQTSTIPEFKSIKIKATEAYKMDLQNKAAAAMANDIVKNVKSVDDLKKQADTRKMALTNLPAVSRSNVDKSETLVKEMMAESIERMFALPEGETLLAQTKNGFRVVMFQGKLPYSFDNEKFSKFKDSMKQMLAADFQHSLRNYLRHSVYPVTINQGQMDVVVGHS